MHPIPCLFVAKPHHDTSCDTVPLTFFLLHPLPSLLLLQSDLYLRPPGTKEQSVKGFLIGGVDILCASICIERVVCVRGVNSIGGDPQTKYLQQNKREKYRNGGGGGPNCMMQHNTLWDCHTVKKIYKYKSVLKNVCKE